MARKPRIFIPSLPYYIMQKSNNGTICFQDTDDYEVYLERLKNSTQKYAIKVHAYALLPTKTYILVTPTDQDGVSSIMRVLGGSYSQYFNRKYQRSGSLWETRYKSNVVQPGSLLLNCQRFIELTPVWEGLAEHPGAYTWSSFSSHAFGCQRSWLTAHESYVLVGKRPETRFYSYRKCFHAENSTESALENLASIVENGKPVTNVDFLIELQDNYSVDLYTKPVGRPKNVSA